ncbi:hypothetical protein GGR51DRAFT_561224 [Nemania sp. FL0031]|nr:hypothetical protein GGR51DRAFT_561224 [Nemania sp. FL0031]
MAAKYVSSQFIKYMKIGSRTLAVEYVDRTTTWVRPGGFPFQDIQAGFVKAVEDNVGIFNPKTTKLAMKESKHRSPTDMRQHYTVFELDESGTVIEVQHLVTKKG